MSRGVNSLDTGTPDYLIVRSSGSSYVINLSNKAIEALEKADQEPDDSFRTYMTTVFEAMANKITNLENRIAELENPNQ